MTESESRDAPSSERGLHLGGMAGRALALFDQAVVSATNFFATLIIGRVCGRDHLGIYTLGFTILVIGISIQESLLTTPFTIFSSRLPERRRKELTGSLLIQHGVLSISTTLLLMVTGGVLFAVLGWIDPTMIVVGTAVALPFVLLRDFLRRITMARGNVLGPLLLDAATAVALGLLLISLAWTGVLSGVAGLGALGTACLLTSGVGFIMLRRHFAVRPEQVRASWVQNWEFGKWVCLAQIVSTSHGFVLYWLLALLLGIEQTGGYAACKTIVMLCNPFLLGMGNLLAPQTAHVYAKGGIPELRHTVWKNTLLVGGAMALFTTVILTASGFILHLLYGSEFQEYHMTLRILAIAWLIGSLGMACEHGLRTLEQPVISFRANVVSMVCTLAVAAPLMLVWGVTGAAIGFTAGNIVSTAIRCGMFLRCSKGTPARRGR